MQEINLENSNDGDDNQNIYFSDDRRGDNNACVEKKSKVVLIESNYDNGICDDNDHINTNGTDNHDNGELILSRIMTFERSKAKKSSTCIENDESYIGDDDDEFFYFMIIMRGSPSNASLML